jgi:hypothetical protein
MKIAIEFGGWIVGDASEYSFQAITEGIKPIITGDEYVALSEDDRGDYIIEDLAKQITNSNDSNVDLRWDWEDITIDVEND